MFDYYLEEVISHHVSERWSIIGPDGSSKVHPSADIVGGGMVSFLG